VHPESCSSMRLAIRESLPQALYSFDHNGSHSMSSLARSKLRYNSTVAFCCNRECPNYWSVAVSRQAARSTSKINSTLVDASSHWIPLLSVVQRRRKKSSTIGSLLIISSSRKPNLLKHAMKEHATGSSRPLNSNNGSLLRHLS
jgi:hypothetical protein